MRSLPRFLLIALALLLAPAAAFSTATTTTIDLRAASTSNPSPVFPDPANKVVGTSTCDADEDILVIQVTTKPRYVELTNDQDWYYRSTASGSNKKIYADQPLRLWVESTVTIYHTRVSASGTVTVFDLK